MIDDIRKMKVISAISNNQKSYKPMVMIIDDMVKNLQVLAAALFNEGYEINMAESAKTALESLETTRPDIILLDVNMPEMDGFELCRILKTKPATKDIPIIFVTAKNDKEELLKGFEAGAVDYVTKPFDIKELLVRLKTHLDLKLSKEIIQRNAVELAEANQKLSELNKAKDKYLKIINNELQSAAEYVRAILPAKLNGPDIETKWFFEPSSALGGDSFGYHWIDENHFAIYLLDVSGHGVRPALHSVYIHGVLRLGTSLNVDFRKPGLVMTALNKTFQMTEHNDLFFTIWYGVYNKENNMLDYASAGHPPALLINSRGNQNFLSTENPGIGMLKKIPGEQSSIEIKGENDIYLFSDGAYEINNNDNWSIDLLYEYLAGRNKNPDYGLAELYHFITKISGRKSLEDDFSILKIKFKN